MKSWEVKIINLENYSLKTLYYSDFKTIWQVHSDQSVIDTLNKWNSRNNTISVSKFDFSTLYINIPHHKLKSGVAELINFCFNGGDKEFIGVTRYGVILTNGRGKYRLPINKTSLKSDPNYLQGNSYFTLGSTCFRQLIIIPVGSYPTPVIANLL